jgi:hypothetical protein
MNTDRFKYKEITDIILRSFYEAQLINYLNRKSERIPRCLRRGASMQQILKDGLLLNFGPKPEFKRFAYDNKRKNIRDNQRRSVAE